MICDVVKNQCVNKYRWKDYNYSEQIYKQYIKAT